MTTDRMTRALHPALPALVCVPQSCEQTSVIWLHRGDHFALLLTIIELPT